MKPPLPEGIFLLYLENVIEKEGWTGTAAELNVYRLEVIGRKETDHKLSQPVISWRKWHLVSLPALYSRERGTLLSRSSLLLKPVFAIIIKHIYENFAAKSIMLTAADISSHNHRCTVDGSMCMYALRWYMYMSGYREWYCCGLGDYFCAKNMTLPVLMCPEKERQWRGGVSSPSSYWQDWSVLGPAARLLPVDYRFAGAPPCRWAWTSISTATDFCESTEWIVPAPYRWVTVKRISWAFVLGYFLVSPPSVPWYRDKGKIKIMWLREASVFNSVVQQKLNSQPLSLSHQFILQFSTGWLYQIHSLMIYQFLDIRKRIYDYLLKLFCFAAIWS